MNAPTPDWRVAAAALRADGRMVIDGKRRDAQAGETFERPSPIDGRSLAVPSTTAAGHCGRRPHARRPCSDLPN